MSIEQTSRTKAKLEENTRLLALTCQIAPTDPRYQTIYNALSWTADDVLKQAIASQSPTTL